MLIVLWLARYHLSSYQLVFSDWLWYTVLPLVSNSALGVAALLLPSQSIRALFVIAEAMILLLLIGNHNACDVVTYTVLERSQQEHTNRG
jgi:hypothetical protein